MKKPTRVNHPPPVELAADNHAVVAPIYQSVKFEFDTLAETERYLRGERPGFFYTRASNPTTRQLELLLAELQGREECLVTASGVGAVAQTLLALTKQGDHILCFVETYNPTRYLIRRLLGRFGVTHTMLSIEDVAGIERALAAHPTRLVWFESPTNPVTKVADIPAITRLARGAGALVAMDNTFAGLHQHGEYDVDVFVHSLTKYASGAGDVLGGAVIGRSELIRSLRTDFGMIGGTLDPHAAYLILRGLKTYFVRYTGAVGERAARRGALGCTSRGGARALPGPAVTPAACSGARADEGLRHHRELRSQGRARGERPVRRCAAAVRHGGEPGLHRVAGGHGANDGRPRPHGRSAGRLGRNRWHGAPLDRARGYR